MRPPRPMPPYRRTAPPPPRPFSWKPYIVMGVVLFILLAAAPRVGFWPMVILLVVGIPIAKNILASLNRTWAQHGEEWKGRANDLRHPRSARAYRAPSTHPLDEEKPKRRPEFVVGDDGELVEVTPEYAEEKPKRRGYDEVV